MLSKLRVWYAKLQRKNRHAERWGDTVDNTRGLTTTVPSQTLYMLVLTV